MLGATLNPLYSVLRTVYQEIYRWVGFLLNALFSPNGILKPLGIFFVIAVSIALILFVFKLIKSIVWGV